MWHAINIRVVCSLRGELLVMWHAINIPVVCSLRGSLIMWHAINIPMVRSRWRAVYQTALTQDTACCQYGHSLCENKVETMAHYKYIYLLQGDVTRHIYFVGDFLVMHNNIITPQSWHQVVCSKTTKKGRHMYIIMGIINPLHPMHLRRFNHAAMREITESGDFVLCWFNALYLPEFKHW